MRIVTVYLRHRVHNVNFLVCMKSMVLMMGLWRDLFLFRSHESINFLFYAVIITVLKFNLKISYSGEIKSVIRVFSNALEQSSLSR